MPPRPPLKRSKGQFECSLSGREEKKINWNHSNGAIVSRKVIYVNDGRKALLFTSAMEFFIFIISRAFVFWAQRNGIVIRKGWAWNTLIACRFYWITRFDNLHYSCPTCEWRLGLNYCYECVWKKSNSLEVGLKLGERCFFWLWNANLFTICVKTYNNLECWVKHSGKLN